MQHHQPRNCLLLLFVASYFLAVLNLLYPLHTSSPSLLQSFHVVKPFHKTFLSPVEPITLLNPTSNTSIEGAFFAKCHTFGLDAAVRHNVNKHWKYFYPDLWEPYGCGTNYKWRHGACIWCSIGGDSPCLLGSFSVHIFRDDNKAYSLATRGTTDLILARPFHYSKYGKAEIDQLYFVCDQFNGTLPYNQPGRLRLENLPGMNLKVAGLPLPSYRLSTKTAVCTKAFYGMTISAHTILHFVLHYLETWKFDYIFLYEIGTTVGVVLKDLVFGHEVLRRYVSEGRIVLVDLRDELQRSYGSIGTELVLLSSKNGQLVVSSDCINRVKSRFDDVEWVLHVDWDEILTVGPFREAPPTSFASFAQEKVLFHRRKGGKGQVQVLEFERHRAPAHERSICEDCHPVLPWDQESWQHYARKRERHAFGRNVTQRTETAKKYAVRIDREKNSPHTFGYGVHDLSHCAFDSKHSGVHFAVSIQDVYLRHYKCLNQLSALCEANSTLRVNVKWPTNFGVWTIL